MIQAMGEDSLELCRQAYDLYGRGDFDSMLTLFANDVEVYVAPPNFESGTYQGREAYRRLIERWGGAWSEMRIEPLSMNAAGAWVLAKVEYRGRTRESDLEVRQPSWELSLWRDGQVRRYEVYWDAEQGRAAFAEREDEAATA
jgi:ketosteroid isomerase-like protein